MVGGDFWGVGKRIHPHPGAEWWDMEWPQPPQRGGKGPHGARRDLPMDKAGDGARQGAPVPGQSPVPSAPSSCLPWGKVLMSPWPHPGGFCVGLARARMSGCGNGASLRSAPRC